MATRIVLAFLVNRLFRERDKAVIKDILVFLDFCLASFCIKSVLIFPSYGLESEVILPSLSVIILEAYFLASSGLCVTIITSLRLAILANKFIIWRLVSESSAPVGSSASRISGSFTRALAIATLCICPPLN